MFNRLFGSSVLVALISLGLIASWIGPFDISRLAVAYAAGNGCQNLANNAPAEDEVDVLACDSSDFDPSQTYSFTLRHVLPIVQDGDIVSGGIHSSIHSLLLHVSDGAIIRDGDGNPIDGNEALILLPSEGSQMRIQYGIEFDSPDASALCLDFGPFTQAGGGEDSSGLPYTKLGEEHYQFQSPYFKPPAENAILFIANMTLDPGATYGPRRSPWPYGVSAIQNADGTKGTLTVEGADQIDNVVAIPGAFDLAYGHYATFAPNAVSQLTNFGDTPVSFHVAGMIGTDDAANGLVGADALTIFGQSLTFHTVDGALVRSGPSRGYAIVRQAQANEVLEAIGYVHGQDVEHSDIWVAVDNGWVHQSGLVERAT
jgi:hypothetical protein